MPKPRLTARKVIWGFVALISSPFVIAIAAHPFIESSTDEGWTNAPVKTAAPALLQTPQPPRDFVVTKFTLIAKRMPGDMLQVKLDSDIPDGLSARLVISRKFKIAVRGKTEDTAIDYFEAPMTTALLKQGASHTIDSQMWADRFMDAQESGRSRGEHVVANSISNDITVFAIITNDDRLSGPAVKSLYGAKTVSTQTQVLAPLDASVKIAVYKSVKVPAHTKEGVSIGMSEEEVYHSTWGHPQHKNRTTTGYGTTEQWVYGNGNYLYFTDGKLTSVQN